MLFYMFGLFRYFLLYVFFHAILNFVHYGRPCNVSHSNTGRKKFLGCADCLVADSREISCRASEFSVEDSGL